MDNKTNFRSPENAAHSKETRSNKETRADKETRSSKITRRSLIKSLGTGLLGSTIAAPLLRTAFKPTSAYAQMANADPRFLIVVACAGGASIIDSVMAVRASESQQNTVNTFPDAQVRSPDGSPFRAVQQQINGLGAIPYQGMVDQYDFVNRHSNHMAAMTYTGTSVTHQIAQKRSLTGNDAWGGRTIQEAVAAHYGQGYSIPNVTMAFGGYNELGHDETLPSYAQHEVINAPVLWPLSLHGSKGVLSNQDLNGINIQAHPDSLAAARRWRNEVLDQSSDFAHTFQNSEKIKRWKENRTQQATQFETLNLINELLFIPNTPQSPLDEFNLTGSSESSLLISTFPKFLTDPLEAQAALAYLLITRGVSVTVTIGPDFTPQISDQAGRAVNTPPLAFDFSHTDHRSTQAIMWSRLYSVVDRLIGLLSAKEWNNGSSYWDRSLIYFASEFGRTRKRPAEATQFSSGHDLNNGCVILSPMIHGNRMYGGVDPNTTLTYGFDPISGDPTPGSTMSETQIYSALIDILKVDLQGHILPTVTALSRS
jgi:hypothetical protein